MLHKLLVRRRAALIERCRVKVAGRLAPRATPAELQFGIPLFIDQLARTLAAEQADEHATARALSGSGDGAQTGSSEIGATAALHGRELLQHGFTIDQVVHDYGDLCQAVSELAFAEKVPIEVDEFKTLNRCLDNAIADAVTAFAAQRDFGRPDEGLQDLNERVGVTVRELQTLVETATLAVIALKAGNVGIAGATGSILDRSLGSLRTLIERSLVDVRATAEKATQH
jgi:hypothetical protein